ncbi:MAG: TorF family putative porin [Roseimicrobium sp.]
MKLNSLLIPALSAFAATAFAGEPAKAPAPVQPTEEPLGFTVSVGYDSNYVFRGVLFADNLVTAAIDGTLPLTDMLSLNVGAWYGTSADDSGVFGATGSFHELDLYGALLADLGPVTVGAKYTAYLYDGDAAVDDINEVGLIAAATVGPVDVTGGAYYDDATDGFYFEAGVSKSIALCDRVSVVPAALVSFGDEYYGVSGFNHVKVGVSVPIKLTSTATLTPYVAGNLPIDALDALGEDERVYGGVTLSVSF